MKNFFILFIIFIILVPIIVFSYFGLIPVFSHFIASDIPTDLGIAYSSNDLDVANRLIEVDRKFLEVDNQNEFELSRQTHHINQLITSSQLTAWLNQATWKHYPFSNLQVDLGQNGSVKISGNVDIKKLITYFQIIKGVSVDDAHKASLHIPFSGTPAFYLDLVGNVEDNQLELKFRQVKLGKVTIPRVLASSYIPRLIDFVENYVFSNPSINFKELSTTDALLKVIGTLPDVEYVKK